MKIGYYIERIYENGSIIEPTNNYEEPLSIEEEDKLIGFRFFEVKEDNSINYGRMYYFGKRLTYEELVMTKDIDFIKQMQFESLEIHKVEEAIFCSKAYKTIYDINPTDKTIEEVKIDKLIEKSRSIFINHVEFLNKIIDALEQHNNEVLIIISDRYSFIADVITGENNIDDMTSIIRKYDLYIDEYLILTSISIVNDNRIGTDNKDTYIRLSDAIDLVKPLYQEYPYLKIVINNFLLDLLNNKDILDLTTPPTPKIKKRKI